jgi:mRNA-degrading endonuclease RelE of RelBE toxin-antitoxin system
MWTELITVAETPTFMRQAESVWSSEEREAFVDFIAKNPEAGDVIPETGGVRKVRWIGQGRDKRGGTRVIYFFHDRSIPIYLLLVYAKAVREDLSPEVKKAVREFATRIKQAHRRRAGRMQE